MKSKSRHSIDIERLMLLRRLEAEIARSPSVETYLKLADEYHSIGLGKESDRLLQLAEAAENGKEPKNTPANNNGLMSGTANPLMVIEVIQILSRAKLNGDMIIDCEAQTFHLYFNQGQIINATSQHYEAGLESFRMSLRVSCGTYRFFEKQLENVPRLIEENTEILLLDAVHEADNQSAVGSGS